MALPLAGPAALAPLPRCGLDSWRWSTSKLRLKAKDRSVSSTRPFTPSDLNGTAIGGTGGTSAASPLWAGFMALVNQQAASQGKGPVGFVNPAIYALGKGPRATYTSCFHDIVTGNTYNSQNPTRYPAVTGY